MPAFVLNVGLYVQSSKLAKQRTYTQTKRTFRAIYSEARSSLSKQWSTFISSIPTYYYLIDN